MNAMKGTELRRVACYFLLAFVASGCATSRAPDDWLPPAEELERQTYGAWLYLEYTENSQFVTAEGEFIAAQDSVVYLLPLAESFKKVTMKDITLAVLDVHEKETGKFAGWTVAGSLSTLTHGLGLMLSLPVWIVTGTISTVAVSHLGSEDQDYPNPLWWAGVSRYARFPQGLPASIDLQSLRPKTKKASPYTQ
jgi:hypothetical protein